MTNPKETIERRLKEFTSAEAKSVQALESLNKLRVELENRIAAVQGEKLMNSAARQTCEQLLKELNEPPAEAAPPNEPAKAE